MIWIYTQKKGQTRNRTRLLIGFLHIQSVILCQLWLMSLCDVFTLTSVFYLLGLSTPCGLCGDVGTSWASPWGCCPLCHLSSPCCRLSMLDKLPGLLHCYGWHTRWLVCMSVCVCAVRGQRLPEAGRLRDSKVPSGHLLCGPLRCVLSHVIIAKRGWGKLKLGNEAAAKRQW